MPWALEDIWQGSWPRCQIDDLENLHCVMPVIDIIEENNNLEVTIDLPSLPRRILTSQ
jgi:HSP20 family molecular chaperone IbpA